MPDSPMCTQPPHRGTHWTGRAMANTMGLSLRSVGPFAVTALLAVIVAGIRRRPDAGMLDTRSRFGRVRFTTFAETISSAKPWSGLAGPVRTALLRGLENRFGAVPPGLDLGRLFFDQLDQVIDDVCVL
jgi:hypothetical protein